MNKLEGAPKGESGESQEGGSSAEKIRSILGDLEKTKSENERMLNEKVEEREKLIGQAKKIYDSIPEAEDALVDLRLLLDSSDLGEAGRSKFEEAERLVFDLKDQAVAVEEKIKQAESNPKLVAKLHEGALDEDKKRTLEKIDEEVEGELERQGTKFGEKFCRVSFKISETWKFRVEAKRRLDGDWEVVRKEINSLGKPLGVEPDFIQTLQGFAGRPGGWDGFVSSMEEKKSKLGFFDGKKKKLISKVISYLRDRTRLPGSIQKAEEDFALYNTNYQAAEKEMEDLKAEYQVAIIGAWDQEKKRDEIAGTKRNYDQFPSFFHSAAGAVVSDRSDMKRDVKGKSVGRYNSWYEAIHADPKISYLHSAWEGLYLSGISSRDPREQKE